MTTAGWNSRDQETRQAWRGDGSQIELYWNKISTQAQLNIIELDGSISERWKKAKLSDIL